MFQAARVRAIFQLPDHLRDEYPGKLAYVEMFGKFGHARFTPHLLPSLSHATLNGRRVTRVIPLSDIIMSCYLTPAFHLLRPGLHIHPSTDLLAVSSNFYFN